MREFSSWQLPSQPGPIFSPSLYSVVFLGHTCLPCSQKNNRDRVHQPTGLRCFSCVGKHNWRTSNISVIEVDDNSAPVGTCSISHGYMILLFHTLFSAWPSSVENWIVTATEKRTSCKIAGLVKQTADDVLYPFGQVKIPFGQSTPSLHSLL